jgi:hypothetical protein
MPRRKPVPNRKRPTSIRVPMTPAEKQELVRAAKKTDVPLSTLVCMLGAGRGAAWRVGQPDRSGGVKTKARRRSVGAPHRL